MPMPTVEEFTSAQNKFFADPQSLTDADMAALRVGGARFYERAAAARAGFMEEPQPFQKAPATLGDLLHACVDRVIPLLRAHIAALEMRVIELEARPAGTGCHYGGTWADGKDYAAGSLITHRGGLWLVLRDVRGERPGASDKFRLVVRAGGA